MKDPVYQKIASKFQGHWDRNYVASKLRSDPLYIALENELRGSPLPLLDLGCGLGLLAFFLREKQISTSIVGLDYDDRKIVVANQVADALGHGGLTFSHHDARNGLPEHQGNVSLLDILQFFTDDEQNKLLTLAADRVADGGKLVIRSGLCDESFRFRLTVFGDHLAKATHWMKAGPTHFPRAEDFRRILSPFGNVRISPLWGKTPFNNHLIVMER